MESKEVTTSPDYTGLAPPFEQLVTELVNQAVWSAEFGGATPELITARHALVEAIRALLAENARYARGEVLLKSLADLSSCRAQVAALGAELATAKRLLMDFLSTPSCMNSLSHDEAMKFTRDAALTRITP